MDDTNLKLDIISGQIAEIKREMVTRSEYNTAHAPIVRTLEDHADLLKDYKANRDMIKKWGFRLLIAIFLAALFSPHSAFVFEVLKKIF